MREKQWKRTEANFCWMRSILLALPDVREYQITELGPWTLQLGPSFLMKQHFILILHSYVGFVVIFCSKRPSY
jgi:hypothetical protein